MATINKVVASWTGTTGLPGISVFYTAAATPGVSDLRTFLNAFTALMPSGLTIAFPTSGDTIDDSTGTINGSWSASSVGNVTGASATAYAAGVGAWVGWRTNAIVAGRRLQGRTFLTPLVVGAYDTNGTLFSSVITTMGSAANTLVATGVLVVWHRPPPGNPSGGSSAVVNGAKITDQITSLRSRRY